MVDTTMDGLTWLRKQVEEADTDLLPEMVKLFCERLMGEEVDAICGAPYGERSENRTNRRNGYRTRAWDTRTGTIDLAIPKLREGSYFPDWLLEPRRRAERAFVQVVCESYFRGVSTRRVEGLVRQLGIEGISKSRVSQMAKELDHQVEAFRLRPLDGGCSESSADRCRPRWRRPAHTCLLRESTQGGGLHIPQPTYQGREPRPAARRQFDLVAGPRSGLCCRASWTEPSLANGLGTSLGSWSVTPQQKKALMRLLVKELRVMSQKEILNQALTDAGKRRAAFCPRSK